MSQSVLYVLLCINNRADWVLQSWLGNQSRRKKTLNSSQLKNDLLSHPGRGGGVK